MDVEGEGIVLCGEGQEEVKCFRQDFEMGMYHLVKVRVSRELWRILREKEPEECEGQQKDMVARLDWVSGAGFVGGDELLRNGKRKGNVRGWFGWGRKRKVRVAERNRQQRLLEEEGVRRRFIEAFLVDREHSYFVTDEPVSLLEGWSFRGYFEEDWVLHLMRHAELNHFVILGKAECIPQIFLQYVRRMKSMRWVLLGRQFGEEEQELVDMIYDEYGLAVEVRLLEEERDYRRMRLSCQVPTVLVDFCEEEKVSGAEVAKGSIWLDMTSSEVKRQRLEGRNEGIHYFSLKKEWKQPQKPLYKLDTISKNGYNT